MRRAAPILLAIAACRHPDAGASANTVRVAAAADLARAFEGIRAAAAERGLPAPIIDFGASGMLAKQIEQGAPYALFVAADARYVDRAVKAGACDPASVQHYARGTIVLWTAPGVPAPASIAELADPKFERIAIAAPDHAPYGAAAKQALTAAGVWDRVASRLVYGDNIEETLQFAQSGNADVAIVARSLVLHAPGTAVPIDGALYTPPDQTLVVCGHGAEAQRARRLAAFIMSADGQAILASYGLEVTPR
jgi:molybdate transport system substrate-binding protein